VTVIKGYLIKTSYGLSHIWKGPVDPYSVVYQTLKSAQGAAEAMGCTEGMTHEVIAVEITEQQSTTEGVSNDK
jgi:hypothetical protein